MQVQPVNLARKITKYVPLVIAAAALMSCNPHKNESDGFVKEGTKIEQKESEGSLGKYLLIVLAGAITTAIGIFGASEPRKK